MASGYDVISAWTSARAFVARLPSVMKIGEPHDAYFLCKCNEAQYQFVCRGYAYAITSFHSLAMLLQRNCFAHCST